MKRKKIRSTLQQDFYWIFLKSQIFIDYTGSPRGKIRFDWNAPLRSIDELWNILNVKSLYQSVFLCSRVSFVRLRCVLQSNVSQSDRQPQRATSRSKRLCQLLRLLSTNIQRFTRSSLVAKSGKNTTVDSIGLWNVRILKQHYSGSQNLKMSKNQKIDNRKKEMSTKLWYSTIGHLTTRWLSPFSGIVRACAYAHMRFTAVSKRDAVS